MVRPPPEGFQPLQFCTVCPPGGLLLKCATMLADIPTDGYQCVALFLKRQFLFGTAMMCILGVTLASQVFILGFSQDNPFKASLTRGMMTDPLILVFAFETGLEAPGSALVGAYGMSLLQDLGTLEVASAIISLLLSTKAVASSVLPAAQQNLQGAEAVLKTQMPLFVGLMTLVQLFVTLGFFTAFTITSRCTHPLLVWLLVGSMSFLAKERILVKDCKGMCTLLVDFLISLFPTLSWIFPSASGISVYGLKTISSSGKPPKFHFIGGILRCACMTGMCTAISLPRGLIPMWTLERPMGIDVFRAEFLEPLVMLISPNFDEDSQMTYMTACFRSFLLIAAVVGTTIDIIYSMVALIFMSKYVDGVVDEELQRKVEAKQSEIIIWCGEREADMKSAQYLPVVSECS